MAALARAPLSEYTDDETTGFRFNDLSERAKSRAREDYRLEGPPDDWWEEIYEDALMIAPMLGIEVGLYQARRVDGRTYSVPKIWFSGFSAQGDGACLEGNWRPVADPLAGLNRVISHAPLDERLHEIAFNLAELAERCNALIPDACVTINHRARGNHSSTVTFEVDLPTPDTIDDESELQVMVFTALLKKHRLEYGTFGPEIRAALRAFMDWIYRQLEMEHDYLLSDDAVDDAISGWLFNEEGEEIS